MNTHARQPVPVLPRRGARLLALWVVAWLAVVAVQATLAVHAELGDHPDDETCGLCTAAAGGTAWVAPDTPPVSHASGFPAPAAGGFTGRAVAPHSAWQARAPPAHS